MSLTGLYLYKQYKSDPQRMTLALYELANCSFCFVQPTHSPTLPASERVQLSPGRGTGSTSLSGSGCVDNNIKAINKNGNGGEGDDEGPYVEMQPLLPRDQ